MPSTSLDQESETVDPFSRADVLYNQSVDKIAALFDTDKYEGSTKCDFYSSSCKVVSGENDSFSQGSLYPIKLCLHTESLFVDWMET